MGIKTSKAYIAFIKKEFFHIFRDVRTIMILILMPIIQILLFGFALSTEVKNAKFALLDLSHKQDSLIHQLDSSSYFSLYKTIHSQYELDNIFNDKHIDFALILKDNAIEILLDASDANYASMINLYLQNIIAKATNNGMQINTTMLFNPQGKSAPNFVPGILGMILMLICAMMTSISIVREKEQGSMELLLISPIKPIFVLLSKIIPYFAISLFILILVLLLCQFALEINIIKNIFSLVLFCMLYILLALFIGLLVSNIAKTQVVAMLICAMVFMMPIMMLSGMMFEVESMPKILQYLSNIIPTKFFISGIKKIILEHLDLRYVIHEIAILSSMLFIILLLSLKTFKTRFD